MGRAGSRAACGVVHRGWRRSRLSHEPPFPCVRCPVSDVPAAPSGSRLAGVGSGGPRGQGRQPSQLPEVRAPTAGDCRCPRPPAGGVPATSACLRHACSLLPVAPCGRLSPPCDGDGAVYTPRSPQGPPHPPAGGRRPFARAPGQKQAASWPPRLRASSQPCAKRSALAWVTVGTRHCPPSRSGDISSCELRGGKLGKTLVERKTRREEPCRGGVGR